jgi:cation transport ATPase
MGTGTDVAIESAGDSLVKGDLRGIVKAVKLGRHAMRNIRQNLFFALVYNALGVDSSQQMRKWWRAVQNMPLLLAACSGTVCNMSQCSTTLPTSSSRKMSMPAQSGPPGHTWCVWRTT